MNQHATRIARTPDETPATAVDTGRRGFIGTAAGVSAAALVAPGVFLHSVAASPRTEAVTSAARSRGFPPPAVHLAVPAGAGERVA